MRRRSDKARFEDTQPLPDHQERLHQQWGLPRAHYVPNHVPAAMRVMLALISMTWVTWALIGVLSGHMFFFIGVPIHFTGIPALLFALAVLASAAACSVAIVDHHDKRDNEKAYQRTRRRLWWTSAAIWALAAAVGLAEAFRWLPYSDGRVGLLSTQRLHELLASEPLRWFLVTHPVRQWWWMTAAWCFVGLWMMRKMGWMPDAANAGREPGGWLVALISMIIPALVTLSLYLLDLLAPGEMKGWQAHEEEFRADQVWLLSGLVACLGATAICVWLVIAIVLQQSGILPLPSAPAERKP